MAIYVLSYAEQHCINDGIKNNLIITENSDKIINELYNMHDNNCCDQLYDAFGGNDENPIVCANCKFDENNGKYIRNYCKECLFIEQKFNELIGAPKECVGCKKCTYEFCEDCFVRYVCNDCKLWSKCRDCKFSMHEFAYIILNDQIGSYGETINCSGHYTIIKINVLDKNKEIDLESNYTYK